MTPRNHLGTLLLAAAVLGLLAIIPAARAQPATVAVPVHTTVHTGSGSLATVSVRVYDARGRHASQLGRVFTRRNVPIINGAISTTVNVDASLFDGSPRYIGISINGGPQIGQRMLVPAAGQAMWAASAGSAGHATRANSAARADTSDEAAVARSLTGFGVTATFEGGFSSDESLVLRSTSDSRFTIDVRNGAPSGKGLAVRAGSGGEDAILAQFLTFDGTTRHRLDGRGAAALWAHADQTWASWIQNSAPEGHGLAVVVKPEAGSGRVIFQAGTEGDPDGCFRVLTGGRAICDTLSITGGSDLAEPVRIAPGDNLPLPVPGMVMVIDRDRDGAIIPCSVPYDAAVAGVISGANGLRPGMVLHADDHPLASGGDGTQPLAMVGRVWVLCDASHGPIRRGDALTTSSTPGHAMVATDRERRAGAVIGKAQTELLEGRGLVFVLVNLQ